MRTLTLHLLFASALAFAASQAHASGLLVPRDGSTPLTVEKQHVRVVVEDGLARTTVRQTFVNRGERPLQAVYVFPLPETAALNQLAMEVGGRRLEGLLIERQAARRAYNSIVNRNQDPALLERIGRHAFRLSVFPVVPNEPTVVELSWVESLPLVDGARTFRYPLELAGDPEGRAGDLIFDLELTSSVPIDSLRTDTKDLDVVSTSPTTARATLERADAVLTEDIALRIGIDVREPRLDVRTYVDGEGRGYFAATLTAPRDTVDAPVLPRDLTVVIDTSGSMEGEKLEQAKAALRHLIQMGRETDRVNVLRFSSDVEPFAAAPVPLTPENRSALRAFVEGFEAKGGTALGDAVLAGVQVPREEGRVATVVLLTDGEATVGETNLAKIVDRVREGRAPRIHAFGVGTDVRAPFLDAVAVATSGRSEVFRAGGEIEERMTRFLARIASPVLSEPKLTADGIVLHDVQPGAMPVLQLGEQVLFTGRFRGDGAHRVSVTGQVAGKTLTIGADVEFPAATDDGRTVGDRVVQLEFARQKTAFLERALRLRGGLSDDAYFAALDRGAYSTTDEITAEIVALSLESGIQTSYTSFLALLPEDVERLDPRDRKAVAEALERANETKRELAGLPAPSDERTADAGPEAEKRAVDDPIIKDAKVSDHNETKADAAMEESLGDPRFNSDAPFQGPGTNGTIGVGGGAGGAFGGRRGGHRNLKAGGGGKRTLTVVDRALLWLGADQSADGRWSDGDATRDPGVTGQALLPFLGYGETHQAGQFKEQVKQALKCLKSIQTPDGAFGTSTGELARFNQTHATLALTETYALTGSRLFKQSAELGVRHLVTVHDPLARFLSDAPAVWDETAVMQLWVLRSAEAGGLDLGVDPERLRAAGERAHAWLEAFATGTGNLSAADQYRAAASLVLTLLSDVPAVDAGVLDAVARRLSASTSADWAADADALALQGAVGPVVHRAGGKLWSAWSSTLGTTLTEAEQTADNDSPSHWIVAGATDHTVATARVALLLELHLRYGRVLTGGR